MDKDGYHGYDKPVIDESAAKRIATALGWEPKRAWVGLTEEDKQDWIKCMPWPPEPAHLMVLIEGIELELRELNK